MATPEIQIQRSPDGQVLIQPKTMEWLLGLNQDGRPVIYWPQREPCGAVIGDGMQLPEESDSAPYLTPINAEEAYDVIDELGLEPRDIVWDSLKRDSNGQIYWQTYVFAGGTPVLDPATDEALKVTLTLARSADGGLQYHYVAPNGH